MNLLKNKPILFTFLMIVSYILSYLLCCYVCWDIVHPFQWAIDLPKGDGITRLFVLFISLFYLSTIFRITCIILDPDVPDDDLEDDSDDE